MQTPKTRTGSFVRALYRDPIRSFGVVSVVLLLVLAIAPAKDFFSQWRGYQNQYLRLIRDRGDAITLRRHFEPGIRQIWIPQLGVVDRCQTCHAGLAEASLADVGVQPFRTHPPMPHSADQFGCVICHRGQGEATSVEDAHHSTLAGEEPILPARYMESSCGQCHHEVLKGTPKLNEGRVLLSRYGCVRCHAVKLPDGSALTGSDVPPPLTHIADKTAREWIYAWLKDPANYAVSATMPNFKLSDADARDISAFLIANSVPRPGDTAASADSNGAQPDPAAGASLYGQSFCASCHAAQNAAGNLVGGDLGPELTRIGNKVKPEWLAAWLSDPRNYDPATTMPHYRWTPQQLGLVKAFLLGKSDSDFLANVHLEPATTAQIAHGKSLVSEYGCAACHEIEGIKKPENFAPELSRIGSKPVVQLVFVKGMQHTLPDYIDGKIRQPRAFGQGLRMPQYSFTPEQVDALTTALLAFTDRSYSLPSSLQLPEQHDSNYRAAGAAGKLMEDLNCYSCHRVNGRGGDMAPDLTWEGSSVQRKWLDDFLKNPNTLRPALLRRMPKFNLSDSERTVLTDYVMNVYQTPAFDRDELPSSGYPPAQVEQGRQLFYSRYSCQSCHIVDTKQDKGYIGPPLYQVGLRLTPAWIFHYLKDPQALRPGTIEPNQKLSDDDARALTAFLVAQKAAEKQEAAR
jgi:cbb3-type cytochrome oxidase cytochrome c subunit